MSLSNILWLVWLLAKENKEKVEGGIDIRNAKRIRQMYSIIQNTWFNIVIKNVHNVILINNAFEFEGTT